LCEYICRQLLRRNNSSQNHHSKGAELNKMHNDIIFMMDEHIIEAFDKKDIVSVSPVSGGLFNTLACIHTTKGLFYFKQYKDGQPNSVFSPPDIPANQRFLLASLVQNIAYEASLKLGQVVPKIISLCNSRNAMIMESAKGSSLLIEQLSTGHLPETAVILLPKILGSLHNNTYRKYGTETIHDNAIFRDFKLGLQYDGLQDYVTQEELNIIVDTKKAYQNRKVCITHGDPNSRNIYSDHHAIGMFDFEQSHLGSPAYDLAYVLCEIIIAQKCFGTLSRVNNPTQSWLQSFLQSYFESFSKEQPNNRSSRHSNAVSILWAKQVSLDILCSAR
jgi:Phosphotransferase enzyme family